MYEPIFNIECVECGAEPVVGIRDDEGSLRCTHLCGKDFFSDRSMDDWDRWNDQLDSTS